MTPDDLDLPYVAIIPYNVQIDDSITDTCKLYYGQIVGLGKKCGYMWATDEQLAQMKGVSIRTIERWNTQLEHAGHITRDTKNYLCKDEKTGKDKWIKKRKVYFTDGFKPKETLKKNDLKKDSEPDKIDGSYEPDKIDGSYEPDTIGGIIKQSLEESLKEQYETAAPVVVFSLNQLEIQDSLRNKISQEYSPTEIDIAVERCLNWKGRPSDEVGIMTTLTRAKSWMDNPTVEDIVDKNSKYLKSLINLDGTSIANTRISIGNKYIEFVSGMKVTVFNAEDKEFKKAVVDYIEYLKRLEDSRS